MNSPAALHSRVEAGVSGIAPGGSWLIDRFKFGLACSRGMQKLGAHLTITNKMGRQAVGLTEALFQFLSQIDGQAGAIAWYQPTLGTKKCPVGGIGSIPSSIHMAGEGGHWGLSLAAVDPAVTLAEFLVDAATEQIAEEIHHLSNEPRAERTIDRNRGVASNG